MMQTRPIFTFAVLAAGVICVSVVAQGVAETEVSPPAEGVQQTSQTEPAAPEAAEPAAAGNTLAVAGSAKLAEARERLVGYSSVQAGVREKVAVGDRQFVANGRYVQGTDLKLRLEFAVNVGTDAEPLEGQILEVCDGTLLWSMQTIDGKPRITRRDVRQIIQAAKQSEIPENLLVAELGLGGLPAMLASVERSMNLADAKEKEIQGKKFIIIEGRWNDEFRKQALGEKAADPEARFPDHIPDLVRIYLDGDTLFPRQIQYRKRHATKDIDKEMVTLDFVDIVLNAPVSEDQFQFKTPQDQKVDDITNQYLQRLQRPATQPPAGTTSTPVPSSAPVTP